MSLTIKYCMDYIPGNKVSGLTKAVKCGNLKAFTFEVAIMCSAAFCTFSFFFSYHRMSLIFHNCLNFALSHSTQWDMSENTQRSRFIKS